MGNTGEASDQNEMAQGDDYSFTNEVLSMFPGTHRDHCDYTFSGMKA